MSRFDRQIPVFGEDGQAGIRSASVAVIGCGGLGCNVITQLALAGIGRLIIADGDTVSESNLNRQFVYSGKEGKKADLMREWIAQVSPETEVTVFGCMMDTDNVQKIIADADVAVDCLDNNESRLILNEAVLKKGIPLVHGAVDGMVGQVTVVIPGSTPCLGCILGRGSDSVPAVGSAVSFIASVQATEVLKIVSGKGDVLAGRLLTADLEKGAVDIVPILRRDGCRYC